MAASENLRGLAKTVSRQPEWVLALAATGAVIWAHFFFLRHVGGFWRDEVNLINLSGRHSLAEISKDSFPALMPLLVGGWTALGLGQTDLSLRLLGTLIGLALPAVLWLAVWKARRAPPLMGLVLLALNSTVIMFGDSLRAFGLGSVLILLLTAAGGWFLKHPTWRRTAVLAGLAILSVQALFQNGVLVAAICLGCWAVCARRRDWPAALKIGVAAVAAAGSLAPYWGRLASLPAAATALRVGFHPGYVATNFDIAAGFPMEQYARVWEFLALAVVVCGFWPRRARTPGAGDLAGDDAPEAAPLFWITTLVAALAAVAGFFWFAAAPATRWFFFPLMAAAIWACDYWMRRRRSVPPGESSGGPDAGPEPGAAAGNDLPLFAGVTLLAAYAGFAGFLWYAALVSEPWYFLPLLAVTAAAFELGLPRESRHLRAAFFGFATATVVLAVPAAHDALNWRFTNVDLAAQRLAQEAGPGDFIIVSPWFCGITFDRYYKGAAAWDTLPPLKDHTVHRYDLVREAVETQGAIQPVLDEMAATLRAGHRVWVLGTAEIPKAGAPMPAELPPAPANDTGSEARYTLNWTSQAVQFLSNHSRTFTPVDFTTNQNITPENLKLSMAEGWQSAADEATPPNPKAGTP